jgi:hypothetical protein
MELVNEFQIENIIVFLCKAIHLYLYLMKAEEQQVKRIGEYIICNLPIKQKRRSAKVRLVR